MQFNIFFDTAHSPNLGSLTAAEQQAVLDTANAAALIWSWYLTPANITLDLAITVDNSSFSSGTLAQGGPADLVPTGSTSGGEPIYDSGSAIKLRTGQDSNGAEADLSIDLTVSSIHSMVFKTDDYASVPFNGIDALSVFLHEIDHGLGMIFLGDEPGFSGLAVYDTLVSNGRFTGSNARSVYGGFGPPVDPASPAHVSETNLGNDLMSPTVSRSTNIHISQLDLAILQDIGVPIRRATSGDDTMHALAGVSLNLGNGNDTGYALAGGSIISGDGGNDQLIGNRGTDNLYGGDGDDYLEGSGSEDYLYGGNGTDIAHYSGLASDYQFIRFSSTEYRIGDRRSGSPDGTDSLFDIEILQWGDGSFTLLNNPPAVTTANVTLYKNQTVQLSSLFQVSDEDGDTIQSYQLWDSTRDPNSGHFVINGVVQNAATVITLMAGDLASATFVAGTAGDNLQIRAYDGISWSAGDNAAWAPFNVTTIDPPPVVTTANVSPVRNQTVALSTLFAASSATGRAITKYQLWDSTRDPASGHFVVNGVAKDAGTVIDITAAELAQAFFAVGTVSDNLQIRAFDGLTWSAADNAPWSPFSVTPTLAPAVISASDVTLATKTTVALSDLFSVTEPNGLPITSYQILEWSNSGNPADYGVIGGGGPSSGYLLINGVVQQPYSTIDIAASQLSQVSLVTGTALGDYIKIRAFNGQVWSSPDIQSATAFKVFLSGPLNHRPEFTLGTRIPNGSFSGPLGTISTSRNRTLATSDFSFAYDADGDAITKYQILDSTTAATSGHWVVNGVTQSAGVTLDLTPAQWAQTVFVTGTTADDLQLRVFDGKDWSATPFYPYQWIAGDFAWGSLKVTVTNTAPVVVPFSQTVWHGQTLTRSQLANAYDPDGDPITRFQLYDATGNPSSGYFVVNGVAQPAGTLIDVLASDTVYYQAGTVGDVLTMRAFDGNSWSAADNAIWAQISISIASNFAPAVVTWDAQVPANQTLALSSLFAVSDPENDPITKYQILDSTTAPLSGNFVISGIVQGPGTAIEISAAQVAQTNFVTGTGASDSLQIRAFDGAAWSTWSAFTLSPPASTAPVVTTTNRPVVPRNYAFWLPSLFTVSDPDGDPITKYQLKDNSTDPNSGSWYLNGVALPAGTIIDITATDLVNTFFVTNRRSDNLEIRAFDGTYWSAPDNGPWSPFTLGSINQAPVVTTTAVAAQRNQTLTWSDLTIQANDPDGDSITQFQLVDNTTDPLSGYWSINGIPQFQGGIINVTMADLAQTAFVTGRVNDNLEVRAYDGLDWSATNSAWSPFTVYVPADIAPVVTTANVTKARFQSYALSSLFGVIDADSDAITRYQLWDSTANPASGSFVVNGVTKPAGSVIDITAAQLTQTTFVTGGVGDTLQIRAFDGIKWSAADNVPWSPFTISVPANNAPVVTTANVTRTRQHSYSLSSLFSVSDADGDTIGQYQLWDGTIDPASGHFEMNGALMPAGTVINVDILQLPQVRYVTGSVGDRLEIRAFDGVSWSAADNAPWTPFTVTVPSNNAPVVTTANITRQHLRSYALSSLFSVSDADGDAITKYQLWDGTIDPASGFFVYNGQVMTAGRVINVAASELSHTFFVTGTVSDRLEIRALDDVSWSAADNAPWAPFTVTVPANNAPVLTTATVAAQHGQSLALPGVLLTVSDSDGDAITRYQLWDSNADQASGHFVVAGVAKTAGTVIDITAAELAQTSFVTGAVNDRLEIRAYDGSNWSAADTAPWSPFTVSVPAYTQAVVTAPDFSTTANQTLSLSTLFSVNDPDGDTISKYQVWDSTRDPNSGHFVVGGAAKAAGTVIDITAAQLATALFITGTISDSLEVRAFDGFSWSAPDNAAWSPFHINVA